jgi:biopolymer transport protein ExbB
MDIYAIVATIIYIVLGLIALWGAFCVVMVWTRVGQKRFNTEAAQADFLEALEGPLVKGDFDGAVMLCEGDKRAMPQLAQLAINNRKIGYSKVRQLLLDRFQRDVLADLEHRLTWVNTVIKSAPMVGLLGTVVGMMGAFGKLASAEGSPSPDKLSSDFYSALITTASGLAIAIPLVMAVASINIRITKMEDLVSAGLTRFLEVFRISMSKD